MGIPDDVTLQAVFHLRVQILGKVCVHYSKGLRPVIIQHLQVADVEVKEAISHASVVHLLLLSIVVGFKPLQANRRKGSDGCGVFS